MLTFPTIGGKRQRMTDHPISGEETRFILAERGEEGGQRADFGGFVASGMRGPGWIY